MTQRTGKSKGAAFNFLGQILYPKPGLLGFHFLLSLLTSVSLSRPPAWSGVVGSIAADCG